MMEAVLSVNLVVVLASVTSVLSQVVPCDINTSGQTCLLAEGFDDFQLATCASNSVLEPTGFQCENKCTAACWHLCMMEKFGQRNGSVAQNCSCKPYFPALPSWCYKATGHCAFNLNCTIQKYSGCAPNQFQTPNFYINLCKILNDFFRYLDCETKTWLDGFRKCVQQYLIDNVLNTMVSCEDLKTKGEEAFYICIRSNYGGKTFCDLPSEDDKNDIRGSMKELQTRVDDALPDFNVTAGMQYLNCSGTTP